MNPGAAPRSVHQMEIVGIHLIQTLTLVSTPRRSVVARVGGDGTLVSLARAGEDDELLAHLPATADIVVVDAPLAVPDDRGQRDLERVLAWCDAPVFPASRTRLHKVFGGMRGVDLAPRLDERTTQGAWEASPDQVLRQIIWERSHPVGEPAIDLGDYRAAWAALRAPVYRPKAAGRARAQGLLPAWELVNSVLDLGGWTPTDAPDDWAAIDDAACIDALCCAYAGLRALGGAGGGATRLGTAERGRIVVPADANLSNRLELTLGRMRAEGVIRI